LWRLYKFGQQRGGVGRRDSWRLWFGMSRIGGRRRGNIRESAAAQPSEIINHGCTRINPDKDGEQSSLRGRVVRFSHLFGIRVHSCLPLVQLPFFGLPGIGAVTLQSMVREEASRVLAATSLSEKTKVGFDSRQFPFSSQDWAANKPAELNRCRSPYDFHLLGL
jgi:hypothetical protein